MYVSTSWFIFGHFFIGLYCISTNVIDVALAPKQTVICGEALITIHPLSFLSLFALCGRRTMAVAAKFVHLRWQIRTLKPFKKNYVLFNGSTVYPFFAAISSHRAKSLIKLISFLLMDTRPTFTGGISTYIYTIRDLISESSNSQAMHI